MKKCSCWKIEKSLDSFNKKRCRLDGLNPQCRSCSNEGYERNKHKYKDKQKAYRKGHKETISTRNKERYSLERNREYGNSPKGKFSSYKSNAKQRDIPFKVTFDEFMEYWQEPCTLCGDPIDTIGLDRVDSTIGYTAGNLAPCCTECNIMKMNHSLSHFLDKVNKIYNHNLKEK